MMQSACPKVLESAVLIVQFAPYAGKATWCKGGMA